MRMHTKHTRKNSISIHIMTAIGSAIVSDLLNAPAPRRQYTTTGAGFRLAISLHSNCSDWSYRTTRDTFRSGDIDRKAAPVAFLIPPRPTQSITMSNVAERTKTTRQPALATSTYCMVFTSNSDSYTGI